MRRKKGLGLEKRYELMRDHDRDYVNVWQYRSVGQRRWDGVPYPDKNGSIGMFIKKGRGQLPAP